MERSSAYLPDTSLPATFAQRHGVSTAAFTNEDSPLARASSDGALSSAPFPWRSIESMPEKK